MILSVSESVSAPETWGLSVGRTDTVSVRYAYWHCVSVCVHYYNVLYLYWLKKIYVYTYSITSIKANIHNSLKKNKIGFWEFEGLKFCPEQISIFGEEVFKQNGVYSTPEKQQIIHKINDPYLR